MARSIASLIRRRPKGHRKPADSNGQSPPPSQNDEELLGGEMSFLEHLEDLRWTLIKAVAGVLVVTIVAAFFSDWIVDELLMGPARADFFVFRWLNIDAETLVLQSRNPTGQFFAHMGVIMVVGLVAGSPIIIYYFWKFIEPGLYPSEKSGMRFAAFFATLFFIVGIVFGYCVVTPMALQFFFNYRISDLIVNEFDIARYFNLVTWWALGAGLMFELPVVVYFLAKVGIATPERMRAARKYAIPILMFVAALMTPPDPFSMLLMWLPLIGLFQLSIYVAKYSSSRREAELKKAWGDPPG